MTGGVPALARRRRGRRGLYDPAFERESCGIGFVAHLAGEPSHRIVADAALMLRRMEHRGAVGSEPNTGDGAGILTSLPAPFFRQVAGEELGVELPAAGQFAVGNVFLPTDDAERRHCRRTVERIVAERGHEVAGWRPVPVRPEAADLGPTAASCRPAIEQLFVVTGGLEQAAFERELFVVRKLATHALGGASGLSAGSLFYVSSLSSKVIVYKGMLTPRQVLPFFPDLANPGYRAHVAMVHSRFSTNTFPSWDRAQPCRYLSHNGEINTLRGFAAARSSPSRSCPSRRAIGPRTTPGRSGRRSCAPTTATKRRWRDSARIRAASASRQSASRVTPTAGSPRFAPFRSSGARRTARR